MAAALTVGAALAYPAGQVREAGAVISAMIRAPSSAPAFALVQPTRRAILTGLAATAGARAIAHDGTDWSALAFDVKGEMAWAWDQYRTHAWGKDEIKPLSGGYSSFPLKDHHLGLSLIEAMDTLWVMGLDEAFADALHWVQTSLSFDVDGDVSVFETSIRLLGGLLAAHHACADPTLLALARDLADRLAPAFASPTGMPYRFVNLRTGAVRDPHTNPAEVGTFLPEWGTLARLTGERRYYDLPKRALVAMFERRSRLDLLADAIDCETGQWRSRRATVGPPSDSYYEYCWDAWQLLGDRDCLRMYRRLTAAVLRHQRTIIDGRTWFMDVDVETGSRLSLEQDELASFYGGLLAQGGAPAAGASYTRSWGWLQERYGVLPEGVDVGSGTVTQRTNSLRPELADAAFNLWLLDGRAEWRQLAAAHFRAMKAANRAPFGYADLADVTTQPKTQRDHCPGYWWAEQMKYYYLIFSDTPRFDYRRNYLSTEGKVLLGFRRSS